MKALKFTLITIGVIFLLIAVGIYSGWQHYLTAMSMSDRIEAKLDSNMSNYDNMWKTFLEMTQVTEKQAEQFKEVYQGLIDSRYDDPEVLFKLVQEQNPQLGTEVYTQLQQRIESGRKEFSNSQSQLADIIREYNSYIRKRFLMRAFTGLDFKNADEYMVLSSKTLDAFENGADEIDLDGDN